uniref:RING-type domain-containing protein n=1 Tax=Clytia hemisphaerica TaxID=252671 RepID=A0A7M5V8T7_9CNID
MYLFFRTATSRSNVTQATVLRDSSSTQTATSTRSRSNVTQATVLRDSSPTQTVTSTRSRSNVTQAIVLRDSSSTQIASMAADTDDDITSGLADSVSKYNIMKPAIENWSTCRICTGIIGSSPAHMMSCKCRYHHICIEELTKNSNNCPTCNTISTNAVQLESYKDIIQIWFCKFSDSVNIDLTERSDLSVRRSKLYID